MFSSVTIPDTVYIHFSSWRWTQRCSKHVEEYGVIYMIKEWRKICIKFVIDTSQIVCLFLHHTAAWRKERIKRDYKLNCRSKGRTFLVTSSVTIKNVLRFAFQSANSLSRKRDKLFSLNNTKDFYWLTDWWMSDSASLFTACIIDSAHSSSRQSFCLCL